jgi:hypothetical protein
MLSGRGDEEKGDEETRWSYAVLQNLVRRLAYPSRGAPRPVIVLCHIQSEQTRHRMMLIHTFAERDGPAMREIRSRW